MRVAIWNQLKMDTVSSGLILSLYFTPLPLLTMPDPLALIRTNLTRKPSVNNQKEYDDVSRKKG